MGESGKGKRTQKSKAMRDKENKKIYEPI